MGPGQDSCASVPSWVRRDQRGLASIPAINQFRAGAARFSTWSRCWVAGVVKRVLGDLLVVLKSILHG